jgi:hypothetical protein
MAESVREAKQHLHEAREAQRERAAAFWQKAIDEGRVLRQSAAHMHREARDEKKEERTASQAP